VLLNPITGTSPARAALAQVDDTLRTVFRHKTLEERNRNCPFSFWRREMKGKNNDDKRKNPYPTHGGS
jgi:hypothetical protein